jgi:H+-transporting ATPase
MVLGVSTALGVIGVVSAFGLFYLGERVFHLDRAHIQTLMYLKLSVAGHLTIFLTRTRGPFWSIRPAKVLWIAVLGTQIVATLIAVYGLFMTPLGWGWAGFVWGYALLWFLVNDRIKLVAYRIFDPIKTTATPESKIGPKAEQESNAKTAGTNLEVKSTLETKDKTMADLTPQIAARAYELYEQQGHRDGQSVQNWDKAEREIRSTQAKPKPKPKAESEPAASVEPTPATKVEPKPDTKPGATPELKPEPKTEPAPQAKAPATPEAKAVPPSKAEPKPDAKTDPKPTIEAALKLDGKTDIKPDTNTKPAVEVSPQLVNRVHKLYEQLGREDVRAVLESEEAESKK